MPKLKKFNDKQFVFPIGGKKIIFAVGMILLPFVFYPLLAFSKAQIAEPAAVPE